MHQLLTVEQDAQLLIQQEARFKTWIGEICLCLIKKMICDAKRRWHMRGRVETNTAGTHFPLGKSTWHGDADVPSSEGCLDCREHEIKDYIESLDSQNEASKDLQTVKSMYSQSVVSLD